MLFIAGVSRAARSLAAFFPFYIVSLREKAKQQFLSLSWWLFSVCLWSSLISAGWLAISLASAAICNNSRLENNAYDVCSISSLKLRNVHHCNYVQCHYWTSSRMQLSNYVRRAESGECRKDFFRSDYLRVRRLSMAMNPICSTSTLSLLAFCLLPALHVSRLVYCSVSNVAINLPGPP